MKKHIGYILLSCIIVVLAGALVFVMLQPKDGTGDGEVIAAKPTDTPAKVYALSDIIDGPGNIEKTGDYFHGSGVGIFNLLNMDNYFPVTKITQLNNDYIYTVYDVQGNDIEFNMYVFFRRGKDYKGETINQTTKDSYVLSPEKWGVTGRILFMNKTLSFADFSSLQVGDSVEKAEAIDPVISIMKEKKESSASYFHTYHLLTDGSLVLVFNRNSTDEDFKLASIEFDENFIFDGPDGEKELRIRASDYANK